MTITIGCTLASSKISSYLRCSTRPTCIAHHSIARVQAHTQGSLLHRQGSGPHALLITPSPGFRPTRIAHHSIARVQAHTHCSSLHRQGSGPHALLITPSPGFRPTRIAHHSIARVQTPSANRGVVIRMVDYIRVSGHGWFGGKVQIK